MAQDLTPWVEHLNGLIFLADPAWHRPSGKHADMAYTFRRLGRAYQAAALAQRAGEAPNWLKSCLTIER
jgi:predicted HD phosphohydrolase